MARTMKASVRAAPTSTTNITGFRHCTFGCSIRNDCLNAPSISLGSNSRWRCSGVIGGCGLTATSIAMLRTGCWLGVGSAAERDRPEVLGQRTERRHGQEQQRADDEDRAE